MKTRNQTLSLKSNSNGDKMKEEREKGRGRTLTPQNSIVCPSVCGVSTAPGCSINAMTPSPAATGASASTLSTSRHATSSDTFYAAGVNAGLAERAATLVISTKLGEPSALSSSSGRQRRATRQLPARFMSSTRAKSASSVTERGRRCEGSRAAAGAGSRWR